MLKEEIYQKLLAEVKLRKESDRQLLIYRDEYQDLEKELEASNKKYETLLLNLARLNFKETIPVIGRDGEVGESIVMPTLNQEHMDFRPY